MNDTGLHTDFRIPSSEIQQRINLLQQELQAQDIGGLFIVQRVDLLYFSGTSQNGFLFVPGEGEPILFIRRYLPRAEAESSIRQIVKIQSIKEIPGLITDFYGKQPDVLGFEYDVIPVREFQFYQSVFKGSKCVDGSAAIHDVRQLKSEWEIEQIEACGRLSGKIFNYIRNEIRPGISEMEFSGMYEAFARKSGHSAGIRSRDYQAEAYNWHILSGANGGMVGFLDSPASGAGTSPAFACGASAKLLAANEPIMIDIGTVLNGYHMDETRMYAIGTMPEMARQASEAAIDIHNTVIDMAKPGVSADELYQTAVKRADKLGFAEWYLGPPDYKVRFVGHGIGCELVEPPILAPGRHKPLQSGMVFALEPKLVAENQFCAGIESVFCITDTGSRLLSTVPVDNFIC